MGDTERTNVVVVGAGASQEFKLPTGAGLAKAIAEFCRLDTGEFGEFQSGNQKFFGIIKSLSGSANPVGRLDAWIKAANQIAVNMPLAPSIDNFLHTHQDNALLVEVGKIAISACILEAEKQSTLNVQTDNIYNKLEFVKAEETWIARYFSLLVTHRGFEEFLTALKKITFVSFNYDRCIEQFFLNAARSYFNLTDADSIRINTALRVIHPYGSLGDIKWDGHQTRGFGAQANANNIESYVDRIKTFTEGAKSDEIGPLIRSALENCDLLIFLGFSFHPLNMRLLEAKQPFNVPRVLATGKGLSKESQELIRLELHRKFSDGMADVSKTVSIVDGSCADLFYEHHRYLSVDK